MESEMSLIGFMAFAVLLAIFSLVEWRRLRALPAQDAEWRRELKATPLRDRRRIAQAVRRGERLDNPRDAWLAVGMAEQQRRLHRSLRGIPMVRLAVGATLAILGALAGAIGVALLGAFILLLGLVEKTGGSRRLKLVDRAEQLNREQAKLQANQPGH
jgi:hypothetical protein